MRFPCLFISCRPISCYQRARVIKQHESSIQKSPEIVASFFITPCAWLKFHLLGLLLKTGIFLERLSYLEVFFPTELVVKLWTVWLSLFFILLSASSNQILLQVSLSPYFYVLFSILAFFLMGAMNGKIYFSTVLLPIGIKLLVWLFL